MTRAGRPRDEALTERILAATLALIEEVGYSDLTLELVSRRAEVSRSTIYKRWPHLADLVLDATLSVRARQPQYEEGPLSPPDTGTLEGDLIGVFDQGMHLLAELDRAGVLRGLLAESILHPHISRRLHELFLAPDEARLTVVMQRAIARGEVEAGHDPALAPQLLQAFALIRGVMLREEIDADQRAALVRILVRGLTRAG